MTSNEKTRVLIVGAGPAAVEAVLALHDVAAEHVELTVLAPTPALEIRALTVATPFAHGHEQRRFPLAPLLQESNATLVEDELLRVVPEGNHVLTTSGMTLSYDALIVAVGGRPRPAYPNVMTFGREPLAINGLLSDIEEGYSERIAFVVPPGVCWPLPAYELALMTRRQATSMDMHPQISVITPEESPLAVFGAQPSAKASELLSDVDIRIYTGSHATIGPSGRVGLKPSGKTLEFQRIVALPLIGGAQIAGLPSDQDGFVPIDEHARVLDVRGVYCVGDAANYPIKQGGIATQQADAAALHVAALAGASVSAEAFAPVLRGRLMTGGADAFLVKQVGVPSGDVSATPLWWPPTKISGHYLTPWIGTQDPNAVPTEPSGGEPVSESLPLDPAAARRVALALSPLGAPVPVHRFE